ncbi:flagellar hook protein FlgE [Buchnera aphidicola (Macrosiphoniella sanborni)]|uniref:Flagellar hook protein FlgE n=1 Tax=Buchnera aphidicola (Macrosiphoniella sanborni) TaxID=1241865 RepID=A0A4D6Y5M4_9GAMM|nr:flagellar hook-basal body complex protein [Buchnera aphidicola]QCI23873.1 flagellar hook protein FlgE [Buchnera aphidicola (Macrosiphoniella sanborni)]
MSRIQNSLLINYDYIYIISNNIANALTMGYKSSKPVFFDIFSNSLYSKHNIGYGVGMSNIVQDFHNGMLLQTDRDLDLAISQAGFFRMMDSQGHIYYTRNGQFIIDNNHNIINRQGLYLTGYNHQLNTKDYKSYNSNANNIEKINFSKNIKLDQKSTSEIKLKAILNSYTHAISEADPHKNNSSNLENYITIYKTNGEEEKLNISFKKLENNKWAIHLKSQNNNSDNDSNEKGIDTSFEIKFNSNGELISDSNVTIKSPNSDYNNININLTDTVEKSDVDNSFEELSQNGNLIGNLQILDISPNGEMIGTYSNQQKKVIGHILLSNFINPEGLQAESGNLWSATEISGREQINIPGNNGLGVISERTLEMSNVDVNKELINLVIAQRNYQSNIQSFKTEDKLINALINLR